MKHTLSVLACFCGIAFSAFAADSCAPTNYGKCFNIHARFAIYSGDGMEVLWPVGTHRTLWAVAGTEKLEDLLGDNTADFVVFGDFELCPLGKDIHGEMRRVCIKEMRNLKRVKRKR